MLCKLDIEKACDQISWKFLFTMLQEMVLVVSGWLGLSGASPLLHSLFLLMVGLRGFSEVPGSSLSSYLFVLGMKVFSILINKATAKGFLTGYRFVGRNG